MKRVFVICLILLLAFQAAWQMSQVSAAEQTQEQPLRVVTKPLEPFVFEQDGQLMGFSIELWEAIAADLGVSIPTAGLLITAEEGSAILWQKDGILYAVAGQVSADAVRDVADSMQ